MPEQSKTKTTTFFVNDEPETTEHHKETVRWVLETAGFTPAEDYTLTRDNGNHEFSDLDEEIPIHEGERFTATFKGTTPTS